MRTRSAGQRRTRRTARGWGVVGLLTAAALLASACGGTDPAAPPADDGTDAVGDPAGDAADDPDASGDRVPPEQPAQSDEAPEPPAPTPALRVVATLAPVADLVAQVGGDRVEVESLVPAGMDAHTYEPRPGDVIRLADADAYLGIGLGLNEGALRLAEENLPDDAPVVLLGEALRDAGVLVFDHTHGVDDEEEGHTHDDEGSRTHDDGSTHTHAPEGPDASAAAPNPHVWTSLRNAVALLDGIEAGLGELDPAGGEVYAANAAAARVELEALDAAIGAAVDTIPEADRTLVTYHDAWAYFARDHGLRFATALQPADFSEPSAGELADLIDLVGELDVPAVFGSEVFPSAVLATLAEETGARYVGDIADDVLPGPPGSPEHTYGELMRRNARAIVAGLGGDVAGL